VNDDSSLPPIAKKQGAAGAADTEHVFALAADQSIAIAISVFIIRREPKPENSEATCHDEADPAHPLRH
jgi:hypothetical protein